MNTQALFNAALLAPQAACPSELFAGDAAASRFAVYRNNVFSSLTAALSDSYPVVEQLVGSAFFQAMARVFIEHSPPRSPVLVNYGQDFADFIDRFEPAASLPYLGDVARLERLRVEAYHAADCRVISAQALGAYLQQPEQLMQLRMKLRPGLAVLTSKHPVYSLWTAHQGIGDLASIHLAQAEQLLVLRDGLEVLLLPLPPASAVFIQALQRGEGFADAVVAALPLAPEFDAGPSLALLIRHSAITELEPS